VDDVRSHHDLRSRKETTMRKTTATLLRRLDGWTRWAFNPPRELTSRYDRAA